MAVAIVETTAHIQSSLPGVKFTYAGEYNGYEARCDACSWRGPFHATGLESAPAALAIVDADLHEKHKHA